MAKPKTPEQRFKWEPPQGDVDELVRNMTPRFSDVPAPQTEEPEGEE